MTSVSKNVYIDKSDDVLNKYNNTYHGTIKMKPVDVNSISHIAFIKENNKYIAFIEENNKEDPKFKIGDHVRISKNKNIFAKGYVPKRL